MKRNFTATCSKFRLVSCLSLAVLFFAVFVPPAFAQSVTATERNRPGEFSFAGDVARILNSLTTAPNDNHRSSRQLPVAGLACCAVPGAYSLTFYFKP